MAGERDRDPLVLVGPHARSHGRAGDTVFPLRHLDIIIENKTLAIFCSEPKEEQDCTGIFVMLRVESRLQLYPVLASD